MTLPKRETILAALNEESRIARLAWDAASENFDAMIREASSGMPHTDSVQHIHSASHGLSEARDRFMVCTDRASKFVVHGEISDDLRARLLKKNAG